MGPGLASHGRQWSGVGTRRASPAPAVSRAANRAQPPVQSTAQSLPGHLVLTRTVLGTYVLGNEDIDTRMA